MKPTKPIPRLALDTRDRATLASSLLTQLEQRAADILPLQDCVQFGGWADTDDLKLSLTRLTPGNEDMVAEITVYFSERIGGCNCLDDPSRHPVVARLEATLTKHGEITFIRVLDD
jgi:hypothetical protein